MGARRGQRAMSSMKRRVLSIYRVVVKTQQHNRR